MFTTPGGSSFGQQCRELERGERGLLGGLQHQGVAGGERRGDLPGEHHQRIVPRGDRGDDADRIAADHAGVPGEVLPGCESLGRAAHAGEVAEDIGDRGHLVVQHRGQGLAGVAGLERRVAGGVRLDAVGDPQQQCGAILRRGARPAREGLSAAATAASTCAADASGTVAICAAGGRIEDSPRLPLAATSRPAINSCVCMMRLLMARCGLLLVRRNVILLSP